MATLQVLTPETPLDIRGIATINAPIEKVFQAYIDKDLFIQWFCRGNEVEVTKFEGEDGGTWHIKEKSPDGSEWSFYGIFHEVAANERIIWTFEFLDLPERGHTSLERMDFVKIDENTTELHSSSVFLTKEDRDGMLESGMEEGWRQSIEALGDLVEDK